jgi:hypothetical protein
MDDAGATALPPDEADDEKQSEAPSEGSSSAKMADRFETITSGDSGDAMLIKNALSKFSELLAQRSIPVQAIHFAFEDGSTILLNTPQADERTNQGFVDLSGYARYVENQGTLAIPAMGNTMNTTSKPYFSDIVAGEPSQVVKDNQLLRAATYGDITYVRKLLASGANPETESYSPLELAAANGHVETVRVLLQATVNPRDHDAFLQAAKGGFIEAAKSGYAGVVELLEGHVDVQTRSEALGLAQKGRPQTPGAFRARQRTPKDGHAQTIEILKKGHAGPA